MTAEFIFGTYKSACRQLQLQTCATGVAAPIAAAHCEHRTRSRCAVLVEQACTPESAACSTSQDTAKAVQRSGCMNLTAVMHNKRTSPNSGSRGAIRQCCIITVCTIVSL